MPYYNTYFILVKTITLVELLRKNINDTYQHPIR